MSEIKRYRFKGAAGEYVYAADYDTAQRRIEELEKALATLIPWAKGVGSKKLQQEAYQLLGNVPCEKCGGRGFVDFLDTERRSKNGGTWGRCLSCRPYEMTLRSEPPK